MIKAFLYLLLCFTLRDKPVVLNDIPTHMHYTNHADDVIWFVFTYHNQTEVPTISNTTTSVKAPVTSAVFSQPPLKTENLLWNLDSLTLTFFNVRVKEQCSDTPTYLAFNSFDSSCTSTCYVTLDIYVGIENLGNIGLNNLITFNMTSTKVCFKHNYKRGGTKAMLIDTLHFWTA